MKLINATALIVAFMVAVAAPSTAATSAATAANKDPREKSTTTLRANPSGGDRKLYSGHSDYSPYYHYHTEMATITRVFDETDRPGKKGYCTFGFDHETDYKVLGTGPNDMVCNGNVCNVNMPQTTTAVGINLDWQCDIGKTNGSKYENTFTVECAAPSAVVWVTCPSGFRMNQLQKDGSTIECGSSSKKGCLVDGMDDGEYKLICQNSDSPACPGGP